MYTVDRFVLRARISRQKDLHGHSWQTFLWKCTAVSSEKKKNHSIYFETAYRPAALSKFILTGRIVKRSFYETDNKRAPTSLSDRRDWKEEELFKGISEKTREEMKSVCIILKPRAIRYNRFVHSRILTEKRGKRWCT